MTVHNIHKTGLLLFFLALVAGLAGCATPLGSAAKKGDIKEMERLIAAGANVNEKNSILTVENPNANKEGLAFAAPLHVAAWYGQVEAARLLIRNGADVNAWTIRGYTPLHNAAWQGQVEAVRLLIEKGAVVNAINRNGKTPLHYAVWHGHVEAARLLIEKGAVVNARDRYGKTPLHHAAGEGYADLARLLIKNGADIGIVSGEGTALELAEKYGRTSVVSLLKKAMSDAEARKAGRTDTASSPQPTNITGNVANNSAAQTAPKPSPKEYIPKSAVKEAAVEDINSIPDFKALPRDNDLAVVIGVEEYKDIKTKSDFSRSDAGLVKDYLKALGFKERNIQFIIDANATRSGMEKSIEGWLPNHMKKGATVFVYYSGHGAPDVAKGDGYIVPYDGDPNYLEQTGYSLKRLVEHLAKLDAKEVIVLLDSCFSGAGGRSVLAKGARPLVMKTENLALRDNIVLMTATRAEQISMSSPEKGHGLFTYHFLKALKDGKKDIASIYGQLKPLVEDEAKELNAEQSPSMTPAPEAAKGRFVLVR